MSLLHKISSSLECTVLSNAACCEFLQLFKLIYLREATKRKIKELEKDEESTKTMKTEDTQESK